VIENHEPGLLLLAETPMVPHIGALTRAFNNIGYKIHFNPVNAPSPLGTLPEARLSTHTTHNGRACLIEYRKLAPWATTVRNLPLPENCPRAATCAIELNLQSGAKAAIGACCLPQSEEDHAKTCMAFSLLTSTLPHPIMILGVSPCKLAGRRR